MHAGMFSCDPGTPLADVAGMMASHRIHALIVEDQNGDPAEIVSDTDVIAAAACADIFCAKDVAATEALTTSTDVSLRGAARMMAEHGVSHLIVRENASGQAVGVLSTTDILAVYAVIGLAGASA